MSESDTTLGPEDTKSPQTDIAKKAADVAGEELLDLVLKQDDLIPWEEATLPSRGLYYGDAVPGGIVKIKAMGIHAEKVLATTRLTKSGQSFSYIFKKCVKFPNDFDPDDLIVGDSVFLLYVLRGITHGNIYEFMLPCPSVDCGLSSPKSYDLNELIKTQIIADESLGREPFKVTLPYISKAIGKEFYVHVRFLRWRDMISMMKGRTVSNQVRGGVVPGRPQARQVEIDQSVTQNLNMAIASVMDSTNPLKIRKFVDGLHARDSAEIREFLRKKTPSIDTIIETDCPHCGEAVKVPLPITESFFRPTGPGNTRESLALSDASEFHS